MQLCDAYSKKVEKSFFLLSFACVRSWEFESEMWTLKYDDDTERRNIIPQKIFTAVYYKIEANTGNDEKEEANILMETVVCVMFVASINIWWAAQEMAKCVLYKLFGCSMFKGWALKNFSRVSSEV